MNKNLKNDRHLMAILWIVLGTLARLLPHPPNMTPMTSIALFGGSQLGRILGYTVTLATLIFSDILLGAVEGHSAFGAWSIFTYTGFAAVIFAGTYLRTYATAGRTLVFLLGSSLGYWLWTNFGIWATASETIYPHNLAGLMACYEMALPFLRNALAGDLAWGLVLFLSFQAVRRYAPRYGWAVQGA
jgi:hypothetical protein